MIWLPFAFSRIIKRFAWNNARERGKTRGMIQTGAILGIALFFSPITLNAQNAMDPLGIGQILNPLPRAQNSTTTSPGAARQAAPGAAQQPANSSTENMRGTAQPVPNTAGAPAPEPGTQPPQLFDYSANLNSDVFGANLFTGAFARQGATQFNPDYAVAVGDKIQARFWGAFEYDAQLTVDPKGNIFLPHIGPVQVLGVRNQDLQRIVESAVAKVFRTNVNSYASLAAAQPVRIFVGGFVNRPGLYSGTSMDSLLHYLDQAGGIDPERGSFLNVQVKRGKQIRSTINLYDFLLEGNMPLVQLTDGDVIFVSPRQNTVKVSGLAGNAKRFEFNDDARSLSDLMRIAKPNAEATHVRVVRNTGTIRNTEYYPLADASNVELRNGDDIQFNADKKPGTITVRVEGEHESVQEYVLPYGSRLSDLIEQIEPSSRSDMASLQLYRLSVKDRQKQMLQVSLKNLEAAVLTARSGTAEESQLRTAEAALILQWVERAKEIEPTGQVVIAKAANRGDLLLENGDILRISAEDGLVLVSGEVLFPTTVAFDPAMAVDEYIHRTGGYTQGADTARVIVAHRDGSFDDVTSGHFFGFGSSVVIRPGDEILVLPKVDQKWRQFAKEVAQIIFQIALSARMATRF
jgi:protein involved in polysaccharide export with SLBB domain